MASPLLFFISLLTFVGTQYILLLPAHERRCKMGEKKLGRPTDNPKDTVLKIRLDQGSVSKLETCAEEMHVSKAEVVRQGIGKMYDGLKK